MRRRNHKRPNNGVTQVTVTPPKPAPNTVAVQVVVPLIWALLLPTALALPVTLSTIGLRQATGATWPWWIPIIPGIVTWVIIFAWRVSVCEGDRRALLLYPLEAAIGQDLDQDGYIGAPTPAPHLLDDDPRMIHVHNARQEQQQHNARDFRFFLKSAYDGSGTTWQTWDNQLLPSGARVTQPLWERWTNRLLKAGLATRSYPTAPIQLAADYRQALDTFRELL